MRAKINTGQKENKLIKYNRKYEFGHLLSWYQILRQHIIEMETWSLLGAGNMVHDPKGGPCWTAVITQSPEVKTTKGTQP